MNPHNKTIINNQNEPHTETSSQAQSNQQAEGPNKGKLNSSLPPADSKDRAILSPIREKAKPRVAQKTPEAKSSKQKSPAHNEPTSQRTTGKKQPKKVERTSSVEEYNWPKPNNTSNTPKEKDTQEPPEQPKVRTKAAVGKTAPRKEPRTSTGLTSEKKKYRGPSKIVPKSREFIETDSSTSDSNTDQEESLQAKVLPACTGSGNSVKVKDSGSNILSVSSLTSNGSNTSIDQTSNDLEEQLFSPIPIVQNELLSPLREYEELKSLWVKIDLSLLSRIPGQEPFETTSVKSEPREANVKHRRPSRESPTPAAEKPSTKSKRKHKVSRFHCLEENTAFLCLLEARTAVSDSPCTCGRAVRGHHNTKGFIVFTKDVHLRGHYKLTSETSEKQTPADKINEQVFSEICLTSFCAVFAHLPVHFQWLAICREIPSEGFVLLRIQPYSEIVAPVRKAGVYCLQN